MTHDTSSITFKFADPTRQSNFLDYCRRCLVARCCIEARPPISPRRKMVIDDYLRTNGARIENAFEEKNCYCSPREIEQGRCCFFDDKTRKCLVHRVKPETCVAGPITFDIDLQQGKIEWYLKAEKICPLAGALFRNKSELQRHIESAKKELTALVHDLDPVALQAILKIEEPETFKIGEDDLDAEVLLKLRHIENSH